MRVANESGSNSGPKCLSQHTSSSPYINQLTLSFNWDLSASSSCSSNPVRVAVTWNVSGVRWLMLWCVLSICLPCPANWRWRCRSLPQVRCWGDTTKFLTTLGLWMKQLYSNRHCWKPLHNQLAKQTPACWGPSAHGDGRVHPQAGRRARGFICHQLHRWLSSRMATLAPATGHCGHSP